MSTTQENHTGWAIIPYWLNSTKVVREFYIHRPLVPRLRDLVVDDDYTRSIDIYGVTFYEIRHTDRDKVQFVTQEEYCVKALQGFCLRMKHVIDMEFGGYWRVRVRLGEGGVIISQQDSLGDACTEVLGQLDPLWKR